MDKEFLVLYVAIPTCATAVAACMFLWAFAHTTRDMRMGWLVMAIIMTAVLAAIQPGHLYVVGAYVALMLDLYILVLAQSRGVIRLE